MGGMMVRQSFAIGRPRSSNIYDYVAAYQEGMTKRKSLHLAASDLALATEHDGSSGGVSCLAAIQGSGKGTAAGTFGRPDTQIHHCRFTASLNPGILGCNKRYSY